MRLPAALAVCLLVAALPGLAQPGPLFESPPQRGLAITPDGNTLLAVNTAAHRLDVYAIATGVPVFAGSIQVGVDPVSVQPLNNARAWVVNHVSDTISIVDFTTFSLLDTVQTPDEPCDLVFTSSVAGGPVDRAFVSCSQPNLVAVFDLASPAAPLALIPIQGEDPRAMALSPAGDKVYVAIHTSGNRTTILAGGSGTMPNVVSSPAGPYGGTNPPPNSGAAFVPAQKPGNPPPPPVGLIVRKNGAAQWMDDNGGNWTAFVSGAQAPFFGRVSGWDLSDNDVAIIDVATSAVTFAQGCMTSVMAIAVQPGGGGHAVTVVGTEATNEIRYEPNLAGRFVRVMGALVNPATGGTVGVTDLNPHLAAAGYPTAGVSQTLRDQSIGDPRGIVWASSGAMGWVSGMGSNNVIRIDPIGNRLATIEVGMGPTGLALDEPRSRLYVLNRFGGTISVVDTVNDVLVAEVPFFDPTPLAVKVGRKHVVDTQRTSGNGQVSCASCHIDGKIDGLAWDLGNPAGDYRSVNGRNVDYFLGPDVAPNAILHHPMKGPMTTQTLQDIVGKEPFHWRGDRKGLEEFNGAFKGLLGDDQNLTAAEMQEFEDYLAALWFPPNPFRDKSNALNGAVNLAALNIQFHPPSGAPVPLTTGNAQRGLDLFTPTLGVLQDGLHCVTCHTTPTGVGADMGFDLNPAVFAWVPMAPGGHGERHSLLVSSDPNSQAPFKVPHLRNMHKKTGFDMTTTPNTAGFGYFHDGSIDTLGRFLSQGVFTHTAGSAATDVSDLAAFMLSFSGTGLPAGSTTNPLFPPGPAGLNAHAGVGFQWTVKTNPPTPTDTAILNAMFASQAAAPNDVNIVVKQNVATGGQRGFLYAGGGLFLTDTQGVNTTLALLLPTIGAGTEATFTAVPLGNSPQAGIDQDGDSYFDADEVALGTNPASARSVPPGGFACGIPAPAAPSGVAAVATGPYQVAVTWTNGGTTETGLAIERSWSNSPQWEVQAELPAGTTSYTDTKAAPLTGYRYRVRAYNCGGESATAVSGVATTPAVPTTITAHVHAIETQRVPAPGGLFFLYATVTVADDQGRTVQGAGVNVNVTGPNGGPYFAVTNDQGQAIVILNGGAQPMSAWVFSVASIVSNGAVTVVYNPAANVVSSATLP